MNYPNGWTDADTAAEEAAVAALVDEIGPGMEQPARDWVDTTSTVAGRRLAASTFTTWSGLAGEIIDALAGLGHTADTLDALESCPLLPRPSEAAALGVTADRAALVASGHSRWWPHSQWLAQAVLETPLETLGAAMRAEHLTTLYLHVVSAWDAAKGERVKAAFGLHIMSVAWIESRHDLETLLAIKGMLGSRKSAGPDALLLADAGYDAATVKTYGANLCLRHPYAEVESLRASKVPASVVRSITSRLPRLPLADVVTLVRAGVKTGKAAHAYTEAVTGPVSVLAEFARKVDPNRIADYATIKGSPLTVDDLDAATTLAHYGFVHADAVAYASVCCKEANRHASGRSHTLSIYASLVTALVDVKRFGVLTRAGIPAPEAHWFSTSPDPWADGARFREHYESEEERQARQWGLMHGPARTWPYTADTYVEG